MPLIKTYLKTYTLLGSTFSVHDTKMYEKPGQQKIHFENFFIYLY